MENRINSKMDINKFRKEYFNKCTERGLYSKSTRALIKLAPFVILGCILLMMYVLGVEQEYSIKFVLLFLIMLGYFILLSCLFYREKNKISTKELEGVGICKICKWYEEANKEIILILESGFCKLLNDYGIEQDDYKQIDLIVDIINSNPMKEKYNRRLSLVISLSVTIIGRIGLKFWDYEFNRSHDVINYVELTIYGYILYQLIKYIFQGIYINERADLDKELIYKLKSIQLSEIRK